MKIGVDIRTACSATKAGKGWYAFHLVKNLLDLDRKNEYWLYTNTEQIPDAKFKKNNGKIKIIKKHPAVWHIAVAKDFVKEKGDVFFAPTSFIIPALLPPTIKSVITVHDLVSFLFPLRHQAKAVLIEKLFLKKALKKTSHILAPSENTKRDLEKLFPSSKDKITVTPLAASETFFHEPKGIKTFKEKWNLPEKFILTVGTLEPRKNLSLLLSAVHEIFMNSQWMSDDFSIVIVGQEGWKSKEIFKMMKKLQHRVTFLPYLPEEDLAKIYRLATIFVFPSLYEGFGIPPLEAMASGCPVICSNAASLPEVVDDSALLFDPRDKKTLMTHLERVFKNPSLREEFIRRAKEQASKFSWKKTAEKTLQTFMEVAQMEC